MSEHWQREYIDAHILILLNRRRDENRRENQIEKKIQCHWNGMILLSAHIEAQKHFNNWNMGHFVWFRSMNKWYIFIWIWLRLSFHHQIIERMYLCSTLSIRSMFHLPETRCMFHVRSSNSFFTSFKSFKPFFSQPVFNASLRSYFIRDEFLFCTFFSFLFRYRFSFNA